MHRSKGREFDNVYVLLNKPDIASDENKRKLYVAFTRAKSKLCVHYSGTAFDKYKDCATDFSVDEKEYSRPTDITLQRRFDVTYIPVQKGNNNAIPNYNNCDLHLSIGLFGAMRRVGTTTYAIQLAEYFTARGAKVAFFSKNELTDGDLNILQETYKEETVSKGTYFTYRNIDFYFFGRVPENWGIYNVVINDYGTDTEQIDNWLSCHYRYIVSGFNETDIIQLMSLLETDKNDTKRLIGRDYRIAFNFGDPSMCGEQYRYLCSNLATSARITMNGFLPYKFNLPQWFLQTCDTEFENYRMYISNIKR